MTPAHCLYAVTILSSALLSALTRANADEYTATIRPLLKTYCVRCHGEREDVKGDVDLAEMTTPAEVDAGFELWNTVVERISEGAMPPEGELQPSDSEKATLVAWYERRFVQNVKARPGDFRPRRLSAHEYRNTLHTLLGFELEVAVIEAEQTVTEKSLVMKLLPTDPPGASGFRNDTSGNPLTTVIWDQYSYLIDNALARLFSPAHRVQLEAYTGSIKGEYLTEVQAERMLRRMTTRAFRRPVTDDALAASFAAIRGRAGTELEAALIVELKTVLMSPAFLYRGLLMDATRSRSGAVDEFELAERLSYFIWGDMPDDELLQLAESGDLSDATVYHAQIDRMLASPKAGNLARDFCVQWFSLDQIELVSDNPPVADALLQQPIDFLNYLFTEGRPLTELIASDTTFINPHTAKYYPGDRRQLTRYTRQRGIEVEAVPNQRITLEQTTERGGLLTMPGILAMNKGPIQRGTWVLERILGEHLPDPPADVGQVPANGKGEALTFRQRFEVHRSNATCAVCHDRIDPLGFSLEAYDNGGAFRAGNTSTPAIDTSGQLPSGETFTDFRGLREILVTDQRERVIRNIVRRTMGYALCRKLEIYDRPTVEKMVRELQADDGTFHDLVHQVADSLPFRNAVVNSE